MNRKDYESLKKEILKHMDLYYNQNAPEISDYEYDRMMQKLKETEREHPDWISQSSPTQIIEGTSKRKAGVNVKHNIPMRSIFDVFTKEDVSVFVRKIQAIYPDATFSVETKIDGLSLTLRYRERNGKLKLVLAETRGDGYSGEDVTANAMVIPDIPKELELPYNYLELRGEVYMSHSSLDRHNKLREEKGLPPAPNARNLASGSLRQLDPSVTQNRKLNFFLFNIQEGPSGLMHRHTKGLDMMQDAGIPCVYHTLCKTEEEVMEAIDNIQSMRATLPYDIDGAVIKLEQIGYRSTFPYGEKYSAGHIAYKYPPEKKTVVMDDIHVDVGRTGKLTFTGIFHDKYTGLPAQLCGTSVSRATLHNMDYITENHIGIGGQYTLIKSGEIIPKLEGCVKDPEEIFKMPERCPVCGEPVVREPDTADVYCINASCPAQLNRTISYFTSRDCMNIMGLGETICEDLISAGYISEIPDIYSLYQHKDSLISEGIIGKVKNTEKILAAIEDSKHQPADRLLTALGIHGVGKSTARSLLDHFPSIPDIASAKKEDLISVPDIGDVIADNIVSFFQDEKNKAMLNSLILSGLTMNKERKAGGNSLSGLTIVVTGTLPTLGRKDAEKLIIENGGKCSGSVSKKTNYVLAGDAAGSKLSKAQQLDIPVISEEDFLAMLKED